jgi:hypothetical protein
VGQSLRPEALNIWLKRELRHVTGTSAGNWRAIHLLAADTAAWNNPLNGLIRKAKRCSSSTDPICIQVQCLPAPVILFFIS